MAPTWFQHTLSRKRFQTRNRAATLAILGVVILILLGSVYLSQVASFAIANRAIEALIIQRDELRYTNEQLRAEIAQYRTAPRLSARAVEIGFRPATNDDIDYIVIAGFNEAESAAPAVASVESAADETPQYDETFSGWLRRQLGLVKRPIRSLPELARAADMQGLSERQATIHARLPFVIVFLFVLAGYLVINLANIQFFPRIGAAGNGTAGQRGHQPRRGASRPSAA